MAQLAEKRRNVVATAKVQEACDATKAAVEQQQATKKERKVQNSPSPE